MSFDWFRWHHGTVSDPKFRVVARRSGQPLVAVLAVWAAMLECASNAEARGTLAGWNDEDTAAGLDMEPEDVAAIREAMQSKTLDDDAVTGWAKRQPKREDGSAERAKAHRERQKAEKSSQEPQETATSNEANAAERSRTQTTARLDKTRLEKKEDPSLRSGSARGARLPAGAVLPEGYRTWAVGQGHRDPQAEWAKFHDYWTAQPGAKATKTDWEATWRNWVRRSLESNRPRGSPSRSGQQADFVNAAFDGLQADIARGYP